MAITSFKRYEQKFMITTEQAMALLPLIAEHMTPDKYCKDGQLYTIYNIYYDTEQNEVIRRSISKPYYKEKLRLRSYTANLEPDSKVFLELKKKIGKIVNKRRVVLTYREATDFIEKGIVPKKNDFMSKQVVSEIEYFLSHNKVKPAAYISYRRMAFFDRDDPTFRLTLDSDILTRRDNLDLSSERYGNPLIGENQRLMEIKVSGAYPIWLVHALSALKIYKTSFSKYGTEYKNFIQSPDIYDNIGFDKKAS